MTAVAAFLLSLVLQGPAPKPPQAGARRPLHDLIAIPVKDARTLERIEALDLDLAGCTALELPVRQVEVVAGPEDLAKIRKAGLPYKVLVEGLEDAIERRLARYSYPMVLTPAVGKGAMGGHYTFAQVVAILDSFAKNHPKICAPKQSIGKSIEGRDIWMVKISDNVQIDENEPEVLFDALHHAREPLSITTTLVFMDWLLDNYGKDPLATFLVDNRELYFVPVLNPDGYEYNRRFWPNGGGMWRKNRRRNVGGTYGVDLNRNWPTAWNAPYGGSSSNPGSPVYRGTKPLSEPETAALEAFIKTRKFTLGCSAHSYSDILLRPWGYKRANPANVAAYQRIEKLATATTGIRAGAAALILYIASGTAIDHYHAAHGMFAFTPELGRSNEGGFWPNPANQVAISSRHQHMFRTFALVGGSALSFGTITIAEGPGGNGNGRVEPGETGLVTAAVTNDGAVATAGSVALTLKSLSAGVTVTKGSASLGTIAAFGSAANTGAPLAFQIPKTYQAPAVRLEVAFAGDGQKGRAVKSVLLVPATVLMTDDFEQDRGFVRSTNDTATTGRFVRMAPQQTSYRGRIYQPGADHSPNGTQCWVTDGRAGFNVGSYDVDNGRTSVLSPVLDLSHVAAPEVSFWLWYSESVSPGDPFTVEASADGGTTWKVLYRRTSGTFAWTKVTLSLDGLAALDRVRLRFTAQDLNPSLVEALIDDLEIRGAAPAASITALGSGRRGSMLRLGLEGAVQGAGVLLAGTKTATIRLPGFAGALLIDPAGLSVLGALAYGTKTHLELDLPIPNDPTLSGKTVYLQQLLVGSATPRFGNRTGVLLR